MSPLFYDAFGIFFGLGLALAALALIGIVVCFVGGFAWGTVTGWIDHRKRAGRL